MNDTLLELYESELRYIRGMAGDFADAYPKIAGRLALERDGCDDPFTERLFEGFAFLTARVRMKMEAEFPTLTQSFFETLYPEYLAPTPSMAIAKFEPDSQLQENHQIPRGTILRGHLGETAQTQCQYSTAHAVDVWPLTIATDNPDFAPHYYTRDIDRLSLPPGLGAKAALRLRLRASPGIEEMRALEGLEKLTFFLSGDAGIAGRLYEEIFGHVTHLIVKPASDHKCLKAHKYRVSRKDPACPIRLVGFGKDEALFPPTSPSFEGYRLLREYFALPERFQFFEVGNLAHAVAACPENEIDIIFVFDRREEKLEGAVDKFSFELFCSPIINLFEKRTDHKPVTEKFSEIHLVVDRTRTLDYEIFGINGVTGFGVHSDERREFRPFYRRADSDKSVPGFYTLRREKRRLTARERQFNQAASVYHGTEVYVSIVDASSAPFSPDLQEIAAQVKCTNRHLPLHMPIGSGDTDFFTESQVPIESIRCVVRPTPPLPSFTEGNFAWRLISHLSLNYLSILDDGEKGATALREILTLYDPHSENDELHWIRGINSIQGTPIVRKSLEPGPVAFAKGLEIKIGIDEKNFVGRSPFLVGAVLNRFLEKYVSINSFTETIIETDQRGVIMRWPGQVGKRHLL